MCLHNCIHTHTHTLFHTHTHYLFQTHTTHKLSHPPPINSHHTHPLQHTLSLPHPSQVHTQHTQIHPSPPHTQKILTSPHSKDAVKLGADGHLFVELRRLSQVGITLEVGHREHVGPSLRCSCRNTTNKANQNRYTQDMVAASLTHWAECWSSGQGFDS